MKKHSWVWGNLLWISVACASLAVGCTAKKKPTTADKSATRGVETRGGGTKTARGGIEAASTDPYVASLLAAQRSVAVDVLWVRKIPLKKKAGDPDKASKKKAAGPKGRLKKRLRKRKRLRRKRRRIGGKLRRKRKKKKRYKKKGGVTRVHLTVLPNPRRKACIGFTEQFPGGAGSMWQASIWIAANAASQAVGRQLVDFRFLAGSEGFIDGPSAGALFTAGFMAAITGAPVRPEVSMTGTVNPDGTVGLVGGLEQKFLAALKKGKKILGYPEGNKLQKGKGNRVVNLETLAEEHGAKAVPIRDIYEAYALLTGKKFPGRKRAKVKEMTFSQKLASMLSGLSQRWLQKHDRFVSQAEDKKFNDKIQKMYESRLKPSLIYKEFTDKMAKEGKPGAAYYSAVRSATWAYTAEKFTDVVYLWNQWTALVKARQKRAKSQFMALLRKRRQRMAQMKKKKECKKNRWKGKECRKLKALLRKRKKAEKQRKKTAKKDAKPKRNRRSSARNGRMKKTQKAKETEDKLPPEPPKDFQKILLDLAEEMAEKAKNVDKVKKGLAKIKPSTVDGSLALVAAYAEIVQGSAFAAISKSRLLRLKKYRKFLQYMRKRRARIRRRAASRSAYGAYRRARSMRRLAYRTAHYVDETVKFAGIAFGKSTLAKELVGLHTAGGRKIQISEAQMKSMANQLFAAAKANLDLIRSVFSRHRFGRFILAILSSRNPEYIIARLGASQAGKMVLKFREAGHQGKHIKLENGYVALGAAVAAYMASAKIIAKWFNLKIKHRTGQKVKSVGRPVTLTNVLHRARIFALEKAYRAQKSAGAIPTFSRILFQTADGMKEESLSGQVKAVELYWRAALYSRLAEMFCRSAKNDQTGGTQNPYSHQDKGTHNVFLPAALVKSRNENAPLVEKHAFARLLGVFEKK
jgi:hypothetical protein